MKPITPLLAAVLLVSSLARAAEPAPAAEPKKPPEPVVENIIVEDDGIRVDELKVRGETQRISVRTKGPIPGRYEVLLPRHGGSSGANGQRVWSVLGF